MNNQETTQHTPQPWDWRGPWQHTGWTRVFDSKGEEVLSVLSSWESLEWEVTAAARIVACVNACAGMADPAAEIAALKQQNAEMMQALDKFCSLDKQLFADTVALIENARKLYVQVKGGAEV